MCRGRGEELGRLGGGKRIDWQRNSQGGTGERRKLCMVPCHICHIYGTWKSKEGVGDILNSSFGVAKGDQYPVAKFNKTYLH